MHETKLSVAVIRAHRTEVATLATKPQVIGSSQYR